MLLFTPCFKRLTHCAFRKVLKYFFLSAFFSGKVKVTRTWPEPEGQWNSRNYFSLWWKILTLIILKSILVFHNLLLVPFDSLFNLKWKYSLCTAILSSGLSYYVDHCTSSNKTAYEMSCLRDVSVVFSIKDRNRKVVMTEEGAVNEKSGSEIDSHERGMRKGRAGMRADDERRGEWEGRGNEERLKRSGHVQYQCWEKERQENE